MARRSVTVLGVHDGYDAGAALVRDGKVLAALQEERPRNIKHYNGTPEYTIREAFRIALAGYYVASENISKLMTKLGRDERTIYDDFARNLERGRDVVDRSSYEIIIDSRRKQILKKIIGNTHGIVLDYGCGEGQFCRFFASLGKNAVGIDLSAQLLRIGQKKQGYPSVGFLCCDALRLPFRNGTFNTAVCLGVLHHLNLDTALLELRRVLKNGGSLICFEPNLLCPISFFGRKLYKTRAHTEQEHLFLPGNLIKKFKAARFSIKDVGYLSPIGFAWSWLLPVIYTNRQINSQHKFRNIAKVLGRLDTILDTKTPLKYLSWTVNITSVKQ